MKKFNSKKLELMRRERHLTQDELAQELNISRVTVNYWENEKRTPNVYEISKLAKYFNISEEQLVYDSKSNEALVRKNTALALIDLDKNASWLANKLNFDAAYIQNWLDSKQALSRLQIDRIISALKDEGINIIESFESTYSMPISAKIVNIPIINIKKGKKANFFSYSDNEYEDFIELPLAMYPDASFVIKFSSKAMLPKIPENSMCIIKKMTSPLSEKIMFVKTDSGYTLAKVNVKKDNVYLKHLNSQEEFIDTEKTEILGKVIGFFSKAD